MCIDAIIIFLNQMTLHVETNISIKLSINMYHNQEAPVLRGSMEHWRLEQMCDHLISDVTTCPINVLIAYQPAVVVR